MSAGGDEERSIVEQWSRDGIPDDVVERCGKASYEGVVAPGDGKWVMTRAALEEFLRALKMRGSSA